MSLPFFYINQIDKEATSFILNEETSKHVVQVLRMKVGDQLQLTDGLGSLITATIVNDHKKKCVADRLDSKYLPATAHKKVIAISLIKNTSRFEWFLEKATEIGITEIFPLICARTEKQHFRLERMQGILISAMLQSKQCWLPKLHEPIAFNKLCNEVVATNKYIAHCEEDHSKVKPTLIKSSDTSLILIGPEGDFTTEEINLSKENKYISISLGETRLRTETAGVVAVTLLNIT